jgi:replicative DNA helicase
LNRPAASPYISQLADGLPHVTNVEHYARIVKEKAVLRGLIHSAVCDSGAGPRREETTRT